MSLLVVHPGVVYPRQRSSVSVLFKPVDGLDVDNRIPFGSEQVDEEGGSTRSITRDRCTKALIGQRMVSSSTFRMAARRTFSWREQPHLSMRKLKMAMTSSEWRNNEARPTADSSPCIAMKSNASRRRLSRKSAPPCWSARSFSRPLLNALSPFFIKLHFY